MYFLFFLFNFVSERATNKRGRMSQRFLLSDKKRERHLFDKRFILDTCRKNVLLLKAFLSRKAMKLWILEIAKKVRRVNMRSHGISLVAFLVVAGMFFEPLFSQRRLKIELEKLRKEARAIEQEYWVQKQQSLRDRKNITEDLEVLDQRLDSAYKSRNSYIEESFLTLENLQKSKDLYDDEKKNQESLLGNVVEEIDDESSRLQSSFPRILNEGLLQLSAMDKSAGVSKLPQLVQEMIDYKFFLLNKSQTTEVYQTEIFDTKEKGSREVSAIRLGFIHNSYLASDGNVGVLLRNFDANGVRYTWESEVPVALGSGIRAGLNTFLAGGDASEVSLPIDVAGAGSRTRTLLEGASSGVWKTITDFFAAGGLLMYPLLLISIASVFILLERSFFYFRQRERKTINADMLVASIRKNEIAVARDMLAKLPKLSRKSFSSAIDKIVSDKKIEAPLSEAIQIITPYFDKRLGTLAVLGSIAPLLGLLGTVSGMITLFDVITVYGANNPKVLAGGISVALVTTQTGLAIAIPVLLAHHFLKQLKNRMLGRLEYLAENIFVGFDKSKENI